MPADAEPAVVMQAANALLALSNLNRGRPSEAAFNAFARDALRPMFARVGWDARPNDRSNDLIVRDTLIRALGILGDPDVIAEARRRVAAFDANPALLPGSIRDAAFRAYAANASAAQHQDLIARAASEQNFIAKRRLYGFVAEARDPALARATLQLLLGESVPRPLRPTVLTDVASKHPALAWAFVVENRAIVEGWLDPLRRLDFGPSIAAFSADPAAAAQVEDYALAFPANARSAAQGAAAEIRGRARMIEREMPGVDAWLAQNGARPAAGASGLRR